jgi:aryl-alcohol dehydrogenase-like predicted oxidoreductase
MAQAKKSWRLFRTRCLQHGSREIEKELVPYDHNRKSILAYIPLQRGLLTGKVTPETKFPDTDTRTNQLYYKPENIKLVNLFLDKLRPLAEAKGATIGQLVIRWTIEQPGITIALVGARNVAQAIQNAKAADVERTHEELQFITEELDQLRLLG